MIGYIEGKLLNMEEDRILLLCNHIGYEILLPQVVMETVKEKNRGDEISLFIYHQQTERQPKPVLIGFNREIEKEFFQSFISVEDIGPLKAVKAMDRPVAEIAEAIESKNTKKLTQLKGIGKRTAQKIVAALEGKMMKFTADPAGARPVSTGAAPDFTESVLDVLVTQLGYKAPDAKKMVAEALKKTPAIATPEELFDEIFHG